MGRALIKCNMVKMPLRIATEHRRKSPSSAMMSSYPYHYGIILFDELTKSQKLLPLPNYAFINHGV